MNRPSSFRSLIVLLFIFAASPGWTATAENAESTNAAPPSASPTQVEPSEHWIHASAGLSLLRASWTFWDFRSTVKDSKISYNILPSWYRQLDGDFSGSWLGLKLGFRISDDSNAVQNARQYAGYLGFRNLMFRYQSGGFSGMTVWSGSLAPGQSAVAMFNHQFTETDAMYWFEGWFLGLRYSRFRSPVEIGVLNRTSETAAPVGLESVFDRSFGLNFYSITFGMDSFLGEMIGKEDPKFRLASEGFGPFFHAEDGIGFGSGEISAEGLAAMSALNGGKTVADARPFMAVVHNDSVLGVRYRFNALGGHFSAGLGYSLYLLFTLGFGELGKDASYIESEIGTTFVRHGPVLKLYGQF